MNTFTKTVIIIPFLFIYLSEVKAQKRGHYYLIKDNIWLQHIRYEKRKTVDTTSIVRRITEDGKTNTLVITEIDTITRLKKIMTPKYADRTIHVKGKSFSKALLIQNDKGDSIRVKFWSLGKGKPKGIEPETSTASDNKKNFKGIMAEPIKVTDSDNFYFVFSQRKDLTTAPNRYQKFAYRASEFGIASMPIRFRPSYSKKIEGTEITIPADVSTSVNVGLYYGYKWGKTLFYNEAKKTKEGVGCMVSLFTGPTVVKLTEENISKKVDRESNQPAWQLGGGLWASLHDLEVGIFLGSDIPLTSEGRKWDYATKPWIGFGLGYKIGMLSTK